MAPTAQFVIWLALLLAFLGALLRELLKASWATDEDRAQLQVVAVALANYEIERDKRDRTGWRGEY